MCIYIYVHIYIYDVYIYIRCIYLCMYIYTCDYVCVCACVCVCMYIHTLKVSESVIYRFCFFSFTWRGTILDKWDPPHESPWCEVFNHCFIFLNTSSIEGADTIISKQDHHLSSSFIVSSSSHSFVIILRGSWRCHLCQSPRLAERGTRDEEHLHIACQWGNALGHDFGSDAHPGLASPQKLQVWPSKRVDKSVQILFCFCVWILLCFSVWGNFPCYLLHFEAKSLFCMVFTAF